MYRFTTYRHWKKSSGGSGSARYFSSKNFETVLFAIDCKCLRVRAGARKCRAISAASSSRCNCIRWQVPRRRCGASASGDSARRHSDKALKDSGLEAVPGPEKVKKRVAPVRLVIMQPLCRMPHGPDGDRAATARCAVRIGMTHDSIRFARAGSHWATAESRNPKRMTASRATPSFLRPELAQPPRASQIGHIGISCLAICDRQQRNQIHGATAVLRSASAAIAFVIGMRNNNDSRPGLGIHKP